MPASSRGQRLNAKPGSPQEVTDLLVAWSDGDREALDRLLPLVGGELQLLARRYLRREREGHTLQTTALVHEAFLKLVDQRRVRWKNRAHFFGIAAQLMRRILIDHARNVACAKRGGGAPRAGIDEDDLMAPARAAELISLDDALAALARLDARKARVVELRYFGGLSIEETAEVVSVHPDTVKSDWRAARAFLRRELEAV